MQIEISIVDSYRASTSPEVIIDASGVEATLPAEMRQSVIPGCRVIATRSGTARIRPAIRLPTLASGIDHVYDLDVNRAVPNRPELLIDDKSQNTAKSLLVRERP